MEASIKDAYFAFVESMDGFSTFEEIETPPDWLECLRIDREKLGLNAPHRVVWLDCVKAEQFTKLDWREQPWDANNEDHARIRRERILDLPQEMFRVVVLLLSMKEGTEESVYGQFAEAAWHRITMGPTLPGIPGVAADDFDLIGGTREQISYLGRCSDEERSSLVQVFNFDFIAEADFGDEDGNDGPDRPVGPDRGPSGIELTNPPYIYSPFQTR